ncbi:prolipoprotein diacylglyceryl transferase [[Mycobacterium] vasticus]|uniref:Phosphatidylglycerol--prolipoprotein diacylglyceryl transferase n=1 Tax=[Mycobacterium] vasticus TaxID=2875777 RepID=A0ABU5YTC7_9MYCO|nr:prolipoprotein diacylglyceryl transferase [Mycolicibacter sp. MYC017]MEB3068367.1 prolipoprotein diacylglyceryl transferase [Mycolicibacter sp. MYC017]
MTLNWLTYFPSPARGVWHLGPIPIRAYALCIIVGIVAALLIGDRRWRARGGEPGVIYDIALWAVPFGLIGGRLYHLMTDWRTYFGEGGAGWQATPRIWDGGLGIWGAVALGGVGAWIACRRRGIPLPAFGDAVAPGIILAQAIGRIGNYFNQELYGRETTLPWGLEIFWREDAAGIRDPHLLDGVSTGELYKIVQPTFLYELLWNLVVFAVLIYADRRFRMGHGRLFALYVAGYCIGRFAIELLRDDAATHIAGIRVNSFTSTFVFIGAVVYILLATKGREDPEVLRRAWQPDDSEPAAVEAEPDLEADTDSGEEQEPVAVAANGVGSVVRVPERISGAAASSVETDEADEADEADETDGAAEDSAVAEEGAIEVVDAEVEDADEVLDAEADTDVEDDAEDVAAVEDIEADDTADADVVDADVVDDDVVDDEATDETEPEAEPEPEPDDEVETGDEADSEPDEVDEAEAEDQSDDEPEDEDEAGADSEPEDEDEPEKDS